MTETLAPPGPVEGLAVRRADYGHEGDAALIVDLLDAYARDPMGGGNGLGAAVRDRLVPALAAFPGAFTLLAFEGETAAGLANCFMGFSTFAARPLVNVHDLVVSSEHRGRGIARALMQAVEAEARARRACKVTLEVLSGNAPAKALYASLSYGNYALDPDTGTAQFWEKKLP